MALNISFAGFTYNNADVVEDGIYYQAFFYKVNPTSSSSKWNNVRQTASGGYYSFNLGDADFLTQSGSAAAGDKILIVAWKGDSDRNSLSLTEWGAIEIVLTAADVYVQDFQIKVNFPPNANFVDPDLTPFFEENITIGAASLNDVHSWVAHGITIYQWLVRYGQTINAINDILKVRYYLDFVGHPAEYTEYMGKTNFVGYSSYWLGGGNYTIRAYAFDKSNADDYEEWGIAVYWNPADADFVADDYNPNPGQEVTFTNTSTDTDPENPVDSEVRWLVDGDVKVDWNTSWSALFKWTFVTPGPHTVRIEVKWWDGFAFQTDYKERTVTQQTWSVTPGFDWLPVDPFAGDLVTFIPDIVDPNNRVTSVDYKIDNVVVESGLSKTDTWQYVFSEDHEYYNIKQLVHWNDGFAPQTTELEKIVRLMFTWDEFTITAEQVTFQTDDEGSTYSWVVKDWLGQTVKTGNENELTVIFYKSGVYDIWLTVDGHTQHRQITILIPIEPTIKDANILYDYEGAPEVQKDGNILYDYEGGVVCREVIVLKSRIF